MAQDFYWLAYTLDERPRALYNPPESPSVTEDVVRGSRVKDCGLVGFRSACEGRKERDVECYDVSPCWSSEELAFFLDAPPEIWLATHYSCRNFSHMAEQAWHYTVRRHFREQAPAGLPRVARFQTPLALLVVVVSFLTLLRAVAAATSVRPWSLFR